ncbi:hypothetical protein V8G54_012010 [Vigna mungo]|uniref:Non-specific serine/threonine protein kinase n=1 Tax=Vigna mungo TaxID=3915 RepID=A0AAQ3NQJ9_VIGMU
MIISHLFGCDRYSLQVLNLHGNQINGTLPDFSTFTSLKILYLHNNKLNEEIPVHIQFPPKLENLYISSNSLKGVLTDYHFSNSLSYRTWIHLTTHWTWHLLKTGFHHFNCYLYT